MLLIGISSKTIIVSSTELYYLLGFKDRKIGYKVQKILTYTGPLMDVCNQSLTADRFNVACITNLHGCQLFVYLELFWC
jgi:hypothetical protein